MIRGEIKILKALIEAVVHKITVSSIEIDGLFSRVNTCNTLYLNTNKILTIDSVKYRITEFVINEYFILKAVKGTSTLDTSITEIIIPDPKFYYGTPRRAQIENLNDKNVAGYQSPIIWLLSWFEILPPEDENFSTIRSTIQGANFFFLDDCDYADWNQEDHEREVLYPMENELWHIFHALKSRTDIFDKDMGQPRRRFHANFGEYLTNKGYEKTIITGAWSGIQATMDIPFVTEPCDDCDTIEVCKPVRFQLDGVTVETLPAGSDLNIKVENQDGDTPEYTYDDETKILKVQTGSDCDPVTVTFNTAPVTPTPAGGTKAITVRNSDLDPVGFAAVDTANALTVNVGDGEVQILNSNSTYDQSVAVVAEGAEVHNLPDTSVQLQVDGVDTGAPVSVVTLDPAAVLNISW